MIKVIKKGIDAAAAADMDAKVKSIVEGILADIESRGDAAVRELSEKFDNWSPDQFQLTQEQIDAAIARLPEQTLDDIHFAQKQIRKFAEIQKAALRDVEEETMPGVFLGHKNIPVNSVGCYVPGGKFPMVASAHMSVLTASVAGVKRIVASAPPVDGAPHPAIVAAMDEGGADEILVLGGVQAVGAMAIGTETIKPVDMLVGPGNAFVAEAKRILFGRVGIDMIAGPTDSLILADKDADAHIVATDLVSQAEHGYNSPVWLVTDSRDLALKVMDIVPDLIEDLPELNRQNAFAAWRDYAEVIVCPDREDMAACSDQYAPEHLTVQADDLDWWLDRLTCYGSLFLGEETTVAFGDKASGTNHVLPTSGAARYTGGLSVHQYMKIVTWQRATRDGSKRVAAATARISRLEGMEGHARAADVRLAKYFPGENFDLTPTE